MRFRITEEEDIPFIEVEHKDHWCTIAACVDKGSAEYIYKALSIVDNLIYGTEFEQPTSETETTKTETKTESKNTVVGIVPAYDPQ